MGEVTGDDGGWELGGYGVLGTGTPRTIPTQDGTADVDSYGVWGLLGTPDDIANIVDEVTSNESFGTSPGRAAIFGRNALPDQGAAIYGEAVPFNATAASYGFIAGRNPYAGEVTGVFGQGEERGVIGIAGGTSDGVGVYGGSIGGAGIGVFGDSVQQEGVVGRTNAGVGVLGESTGDGLAGRFVGNVEISGVLAGDLQVTGTCRVAQDVEVAGDIRLNGFDVAEAFELAGMSEGDPGTVVVIDDDGRMQPSSQPYDPRVVGVVSGAGAWKPGLVLDGGEAKRSSAPVALVGRAYCKVTAGPAAIAVGDLLTTSETTGHAMRVTDPGRAFGSIIGKALAPLAGGTDLIPILIALQ